MGLINSMINLKMRCVGNILMTFLFLKCTIEFENVDFPAYSNCKFFKNVFSSKAFFCD
jgi:hypothetical protein